MNLYKINYKEDFFTEVTNYVIANFKHNLIDLKIILPSGYECSHLQKCLISRIGTSLLPKIITISEVSAENEEVFQIPSQQFVAASSLEEKFWLAEIIHSYEKLGYNLQHAIALSQELAFLFNELEANEIGLKQVKEVPNIDQSKHWDFIYDFLHFAKQKWQDKLSISSKLSKAKYKQLMFTAEIERLTNNQDQSLLIAGISGGNLLLKKFCKSVVNLPNGHIILPPTAGVTELNDIRPDDGLFAIAELLKTLEKKLTDFTVLGS
ncbi:MAG: hypothetical protein HRU35_08230, partial [Rickettsiaceae bacterium]|nr:hypothetical protein [Rickettsiaceae bacterium]